MVRRNVYKEQEGEENAQEEGKEMIEEENQEEEE